MPLTLEGLGQLVTRVARECQVTGEVIGVTPAEGGGPYAEVIVSLVDSAARQKRVSLGLPRDAAVDDLRAQIAAQLECASR